MLKRFREVADLVDEEGWDRVVEPTPVRMVTPGRYFYKSVKWLETIELRAENKLGYWEAGPGYHDNADPWEEERFITGNIPPDLRGGGDAWIAGSSAGHS